MILSIFENLFAPNSPEDVEARKPKLKGFKVGDRIEMVRMRDDPYPIEPGTKGTIVNIGNSWYSSARVEWDVDVTWDNGRKLMVILPYDRIKKINTE